MPVCVAVLALSALLGGAAPDVQSAAPSAAGSAPNQTSLTVASPRGQRRLSVRNARGFPALRVSELAQVLSVESGMPDGGTTALRVAGQQFDLVLDAPYFRYGNSIYVLAGAPYLAGDSLFVPLQFAVEFLPRLLAGRFRFDSAQQRLEELPAPAAAPRPPPESPSAPARRVTRVVVIDPGHGGRDVGMLGPIGQAPFLREKDVTLAIGRELAAELGRRGVRAVLTRTTDTLIALRDRGRMAGAESADLFISIHVNAANPRWRDAAGARGFETYFLAEARTEDARRVAQMENESVRFETSADAPSGDPLAFILNDLALNEHLRESGRLAELIEGDLGRVHPGESRGVKQAGFAVLSTSYMPAVLVEIGFGSNPDEARYLTSTSGQRRLARAIADAVAKYLAGYERRISSPGAERQR
jgi:N-acetylmuramoyl-L-alanine amidase